jgi:hypothetical protein
VNLPLQPHGVTVTWADRNQAREDLALRRERCAVKHGDELYSVAGDYRVVDGYARRCKGAGWTVVRDPKGIA